MATRKPKILLVEDNESELFGYERYLQNVGFDTVSVTTLAATRTVTREQNFSAVILDLRLPDGNALNWLPEFKRNYPDTGVVVVTGSGDVNMAVDAMKKGAENLLTKPASMDALKTSIDKCVELHALRKRARANERATVRHTPYFGTSSAAHELQELLEVAAASDAVILLQGETGTGKGIIARWIHEHSNRANEPCVKLNCSSLKGDLLRSELFGHTKGAFTSAITDREGLVEIADGGTLFLDEIGDMDLAAQAQLLTTLEEHTYRRVGDSDVRTSEFRLICATNKDLVRESLNAGTFRSDLYYRICVFPITIPPLRKRRDDIPGLTAFFLKEYGYPHLPLDDDLVEWICRYDWPGNIRELRNMLERALLLARGEPLKQSHFPGLTQDTASSTRSTPLNLKEAERSHVQSVLDQCNGNKTRASELLGISLSSLYRKLDTPD